MSEICLRNSMTRCFPFDALITKSRLQNSVKFTLVYFYSSSVDSGRKLNGTTTLNSATTIHPFYLRNSGFARKNQGSLVTLNKLLNNVVH